MSTLALKLIACVAMLCDHIGYFGVLPPAVSLGMRIVGRIAFPIYCYLLSFGFRKTHNKYLYLARLAAFAVISELPFNYCFYGTVSFGFKNVFFTLSLGLAAVLIYDIMAQGRGLASKLLAIVPTVLFALIADWLETDYAGFGVALIFLFYMAGESKLYASVVCVLFGARYVLDGLISAIVDGFAHPYISDWDWIAMFAAASAIPILLCNGSRGAYPRSRVGKLLYKYAFYAYYPVHMLLLGLIMHRGFGV